MDGRTLSLVRSFLASFFGIYAIQVVQSPKIFYSIVLRSKVVMMAKHSRTAGVPVGEGLLSANQFIVPTSAQASRISIPSLHSVLKWFFIPDTHVHYAPFTSIGKTCWQPTFIVVSLSSLSEHSDLFPMSWLVDLTTTCIWRSVHG